MVDTTVIGMFARRLLWEAVCCVQTDEEHGTPAWERDVRFYALQSVALDEKRQCVSTVMILLKRKIKSLPIPVTHHGD